MTHLTLVPHPDAGRPPSDENALGPLEALAAPPPSPWLAQIPRDPSDRGVVSSGLAVGAHGFLDYLVQRVYLWPAAEPRAWRAGLLAQRLGLAPEKVVDLAFPESGRSRRPQGRRSRARGWLRRALRQAETRGDRRILVLRDDLIFHRDFDHRLEELLGRDGIYRSRRLGPSAYLLESESFAVLRRVLAKGAGDLVDGLGSEALDSLVGEVVRDDASLEAGRLVLPRRALPDHGDGEFSAEVTMARISFCCATRRPAFLDNVLRNAGRQSYSDCELVLVLDGWRAPADLDAWARRAGVERLKVIERPEGSTLGECLMIGLAEATGVFWAKLDDDDFYDRDYLLEAWEHLGTLGVDLVGKPRFHVFFPRLHQGCTTTDREYAGLDFERHNGATIFGRRRTIEALGFESLDLGEDLELYRAAARRGLRLGDTSLENYVYIRHGDNTSEFERHLSEPWDLDASPLYRGLVRSFAPAARPDLARLELPDLRRFVQKVVAPRQRRRRIPKVIHQIWIGPEPRPRPWMETWQRDFITQHPDWEYRLWTEDEVADLDVVHDPVYHHLSYCGRADLLRYRILHRHGGVFIDADSAYLGAATEAVAGRPSLGQLIAGVDGCGLVMAEEPFRRGEPPLIAVGVIASLAHNPLLEVFIRRGIAAVEECLARGGHLQAWETTGPLMVTEVLEAVGCRSILPAHVFYPVYWDSQEHWRRPLDELARAYPDSLMFQFGYSTNQLQHLEGGAIFEGSEPTGTVVGATR